MLNKKFALAAIVASSAFALIAGCASTEQAAEKGTASATSHAYLDMAPEQLAEHLIFRSGSFDLDQPVQEGGVSKQRMEQDTIQKLCSESRNKPSIEQIHRITAEARASIKYPKDGIKLGDWKKGGELAWSGFGYRIVHNVDDHSKREVGGNCYNCHELSPQRTGGTIGPSLTGYGMIRGNDENMRRFVYEMIYNANTYFPCTNMPRMGDHNLLSEEQIADIMAYMLDLDSPVNK